MIFGFTLTCLRLQKGMRQKAVAHGIGMDPSQLSRIETGRKKPPNSDSLIKQLATQLELSSEETVLLYNCALADSQLGDFAVGATFEQVSLAILFANKLKQLTTAQITAITAIIAIDAKSSNNRTSLLAQHSSLESTP
ncbi:helix-turn-helix domain-containing protein [Iodobacter fluviatilis]|uniref:Helix-turn-helix domain n=1 Tax=Iodobacter fluviatilis TaxID=537 RepID=A0A377STS2_9NEIS|nr:helix-turn-helix transcriptional regulator [Iodobacter fluviatilis]TCU81625.1 helix-turn-helix protein [Iodobacter fluviatilis]STR44775.1 Helix-turn-helix domain [Iodobacter fluviatilis]